MMLIIPTQDEEEFVDAADKLEGFATDNQDQATINAVKGHEGCSTLKVEAYIKKQRVIILIDFGTTHNVLDIFVAKRLHLPIHSESNLRVNVTGGHILMINKHCNKLSWSMAETNFEDDFLVMDLHIFDTVLGAQWLTRMDRIILDMDHKFMAFSHKGHYCELYGLGSSPIGPMDNAGVIADL